MATYSLPVPRECEIQQGLVDGLGGLVASYVNLGEEDRKLQKLALNEYIEIVSSGLLGLSYESIGYTARLLNQIVTIRTAMVGRSEPYGEKLDALVTALLKKLSKDGDKIQGKVS